MSETYKVIKTTYAIHRKHGAKAGHPTTLRVDHHIERDWSKPTPGKPVISEYVCLDHKGFARKKAEAWWKHHTDAAIPNGYGLVNVDRAYWLAVYGALKKTIEITVAQDEGDFRTIVSDKLGSLPTEEEICDYLLPNK